MICQHEQPIAKCSICNTPVKKLMTKPPRIDGPEPAPKDGRCPACGDIYERGDEVVPVSFWRKRGRVFYHQLCAEEKLDA